MKAMLEQERQRIEQLTAGWDDPTQVDWGNDEGDENDGTSTDPRPTGPLLKCTALYSYTAQNPDELTIVENEQLDVVGEGDGDGWLRARNYRGEEGYVPHNYLDVEREQSTTTPGLVTQISFSSVDYTVENDEDIQQSETNQSPEQISVISMPQKSSNKSISYCCALYDYEGEGEEELTFEEGQIIKVLSKCAHSVDDGWWKGELENRIGNFPSLVVEECDEFGEPITNEWDETPPCSAPPVFTPPDVPNFLIAPAEVVITQATPSVEHEQDEVSVNKDESTNCSKQDTSKGFAMELSHNQQEHYGSQFDKSAAVSTAVDVPTVLIEGQNTQEECEDGSGQFGLGVAQIVITAATPMVEEPEHPFPTVEETTVNHTEDINSSVHEDTLVEEQKDEEKEVDINDDVEEKSIADDQPTDSAPFPVSSSTGSDGDTTGPSTAENSASHAAPLEDIHEPKQVIGGRASIPDELEPHQLARLQDLKESNA